MPLGDRRENPYAECTVLAADDGLSYQLAGYRGSGGCTIVEMDQYVGICGDLCPLGNRGVWSTRGYTLDWFAGATEANYLASKFRRAAWYADVAEHQLRDLLADANDCTTESEVVALKSLIGARAWDDGEDRFVEACVEAGLDVSEGAPGVGFCTWDVVLLAGLREKIAEFRASARPTPWRARGPTNLGQHRRPGIGRP